MLMHQLNFGVVGSKAEPCPAQHCIRIPTRHNGSNKASHEPTHSTFRQRYLPRRSSAHESYQAGEPKPRRRDLYLPRRREFGLFCRVLSYLVFLLIAVLTGNCLDHPQSTTFHMTRRTDREPRVRRSCERCRYVFRLVELWISLIKHCF